MTTNINVIVNKENLVDQIKLQQAANRKVAEEKEKEKKLEAEAEAEAGTEAEGQAQRFPGSPSGTAPAGEDAAGESDGFGLPREQPQIKKRPAASPKSPLVNILLQPDIELLEGNVFQGKSKGIKGLTRPNVLPFTNYLGDVTSVAPVYISAGPEGSVGACEVGVRGGILAESSSGSYASSAPKASPIVQNAYTSGIMYGTDPLNEGETEYIVTPEQSAPAKEKISNYAKWTAEAWFRTGSPSGSLYPSTSTYMGIDAPGFRFGTTLGYSSSEGAGRPSLLYGYSSLLIYGVDYNNTPEYGTPLYINPIYASNIKRWGVEMRDANWVAAGDRFGDLPEDLKLPFSYSTGGWNHFAAVYVDGVFNFFLNGIFLVQVSVPNLPYMQMRSTELASTQYFKWTDAPIYLSWAGGHLGPSTFGPGAIHGLRFTPKELYSDSFTPPPTITDFA